MSQRIILDDSHNYDIDDDDVTFIEHNDDSSMLDDNIQYRLVYMNKKRYEGMNKIQIQCVDNSSNSTEFIQTEPCTSSATIPVSKSGLRNQHGPLTEWKPEEVKLMLSSYKEYITNVGKDKTFKSKKEMWNTIAKNISDTFNVSRTPTQCMTKFKTLKKAKRLGTEVEANIQAAKIQNEMESMDSIFHEVMEDSEAARINEIENGGQGSYSSEVEILAKILPKTLIELAKVNARAQERRHREHMDFLRGFESRYMEMLEKKLK